MRRIYYNIMYIFACVWCLTACVGEELDGAPSAGKGKGLLRLSIGKVDATVKGEVETKAVTNLKNTPSAEQCTIAIKRGGNNIEGFPKLYSTIKNEAIELPAGTYTVQAYWGKDELIQSDAYFFDEETVDVSTANPSSPIELNPKLANAMLEFDPTDMSKYFTDWTMVAQAGTESKTLASKEQDSYRLFVRAGENVNIELRATNTLRKPVTHTQSVTTSAEAQTGYFITYDPNWDAFKDIIVTATGKHTYDGETLTGTDITVALDASNSSADVNAIKEIQLLYNGQVVRSGKVGEKLRQDGNLPYIPRNAELKAKFIFISENDDVINNHVTTNINKPDIHATVTGKTSYSIYKSQGAAEANTKDGSSIYASAEVKLSEEIKNNSIYKDLYGEVTYTVDEDNISIGQYGIEHQISSLAWQKHTLKAQVSFDGGEAVTNVEDCYVTGLPYTPATMVESDWEFASWNCKHENNYVQLGGVSGSGECTATSTMKFYVPENIGVNLITNVTVRDYKLVRWYETIFTIKVNGTNVISQPGNHEDNSNTGKNYDLSGKGTFTPNQSEIKMNSSYKAAGPWSKVYKLHILYD